MANACQTQDRTSVDPAAILSRIPETIYSARFTDDGIEIAFISPTVRAITGCEPQEFCDGRLRWIDLVHEKDREAVQAAWNNCRRKPQPFQEEYRITAKDGTVRDVWDRAEPVADAHGAPVGLDGIMMDVTARRSMERHLERTQMLQSIGRLAAGIAHEINTPVQFIGDNVHFLSDSFSQVLGLVQQYQRLREGVASGAPDQSLIAQIAQAEQQADIAFLSTEIPKAIEQTTEGVKRVTAIVKAMRDFSHMDERRMGSADINRALESTLIVAHHQLKYVADVETHFDKSLPMVMCCVDDLNQVFVNLLVNAAHAIGDVVGKDATKRGRITVTTRKDGPNAVISFADTGTGIPREVQEHMFEPFFTTKGHDKGTGQGLLFVKTVVCNKHKGTLDCTTETGKGTTFTITIPIEQAQPRRT